MRVQLFHVVLFLVGVDTFDAVLNAGTLLLKRKPAERELLTAGVVGAGGFEPPKSKTTDLQSAPFGHSGTLPYAILCEKNGAGGRT